MLQRLALLDLEKVTSTPAISKGTSLILPDTPEDPGHLGVSEPWQGAVQEIYGKLIGCITTDHKLVLGAIDGGSTNGPTPHVSL
jgi:hypothetical protein